MKRQLSLPDTASLCESRLQSFAPQKRRRTSGSEANPSQERLQAPLTPKSSPVDNQQQQPQRHQRQCICVARSQSILDWACGVAYSRSMSDRASQSQRRARKATVRARSASPTKKSPEYRQVSMARAHIYINHIFDLPTDIDLLRCRIIGDAYDNACELKGIPDKLKRQVQEIANDYLHDCRQLERDARGEAEWKSALLECVFRRLVKLFARDTLATSASDKPWRTELKPQPLSLQDLLSCAIPRLRPAADLAATALTTSNLISPPSPAGPSETATTTSETTAASTMEDLDSDNPLTTPKPDILVGLARQSFTEVHQVLLGELQDSGQLLSEPQLVQHGLHFPFLLVEAKGLATSGNMMGAENQAAVGGACAMNILKALHSLEPNFPLARIVFSISNEGPLHQLFIHYCIDGKYYMTVHRAWRATLQRDCIEFILALARIIQWGEGEYRDAIIASLARIIERLQD